MRLLLLALAALAAFTTFDHAMRVDQQHICQTTDDLECPTTLWWFD